MSEIERIARLLRETFEGKPYYGPSVLGALAAVDAEIALLAGNALNPTSPADARG